MRWQIHWWDPLRRRISSNWVERTPSARLAEYVISSPRALQPLLPWRTVDIFVSNKILKNMLNTYSNSGRRHRSAYNGKLFVHSRNPPSSNWNHRCRVSKRKENCTFLLFPRWHACATPTILFEVTALSLILKQNVAQTQSDKSTINMNNFLENISWNCCGYNSKNNFGPDNHFNASMFI